VDKINILMVDDQPGKLLTYEAILGGLGENLIKARSGDDALACLLETEIAVVLMDVSMPGLDGFQLTEMIHQHPRFQNTTIIFISGAHLTDADRLRGYEQGAVDYISVPIIPELLRAKVRVFAELYRNKRELEMVSAQMITALDEERRRIARELHDGLGQELSLARILADRLGAADGRTAELCQVLDNALQQMRSIAYLLHPPLLEELGLESAVRWYLEGLTKRSGIETSLEIEPSDFLRLPKDLENAVYRIVQEALTNVFRHSRARRVCVKLKQTNGQVSVAIQDDGKGIPEAVAQFRPGVAGVGISGMIQRLKKLGGNLKMVNTNPGTLVEAAIPIQSAPPDRSGLMPAIRL
jgi:signal transduction histidine kinase